MMAGPIPLQQKATSTLRSPVLALHRSDVRSPPGSTTRLGRRMLRRPGPPDSRRRPLEAGFGSLAVARKDVPKEGVCGLLVVPWDVRRVDFTCFDLMSERERERERNKEREQAKARERERDSVRVMPPIILEQQLLALKGSQVLLMRSGWGPCLSAFWDQHPLRLTAAIGVRMY